MTKSVLPNSTGLKVIIHRNLHGYVESWNEEIIGWTVDPDKPESMLPLFAGWRCLDDDDDYVVGLQCPSGQVMDLEGNRYSSGNDFMIEIKKRAMDDLKAMDELGAPKLKQPRKAA